jgi:3-hydroxybutyryl-CoA dehydratase
LAVSYIRSKAVSGLKVGDIFTITRTLTHDETLEFGRLTRDYNPVHYDKRFAEAKGFEGLICHGLLTGGMVCEVGGQIGWLASKMEFSFKRPVYFGDSITCRVTITKLESNGKAEALAVMTNQEGLVVVEAQLEGFIPGKAEKQILQVMQTEGDPTNPLA